MKFVKKVEVAETLFVRGRICQPRIEADFNVQRELRMK